MKHVNVTHTYAIFPTWDFPLFSPQALLSTFCHTCLRCAACIGKWLSQAVLKPYVFLRGLLLLAGDVERNPGPIQGRLKELLSVQLLLAVLVVGMCSVYAILLCTANFFMYICGHTLISVCAILWEYLWKKTFKTGISQKIFAFRLNVSHVPM